MSQIMDLHDRIRALCQEIAPFFPRADDRLALLADADLRNVQRVADPENRAETFFALLIGFLWNQPAPLRDHDLTALLREIRPHVGSRQQDEIDQLVTALYGQTAAGPRHKLTTTQLIMLWTLVSTVLVGLIGAAATLVSGVIGRDDIPLFGRLDASPTVVTSGPDRTIEISDIQLASTATPTGVVVPVGQIQLSFVYVGGGEFLMGSSKDDYAEADEFPQTPIDVDAFYMGQYPITVAQFAAFVEETDYITSAENGMGLVYPLRDEARRSTDEERWSTDVSWRTPLGAGDDVTYKQDHPVTMVSLDDAMAFCEWASRETGYVIRVPTEAEWEKAARGTDGAIWPWGDEPPDRSLCNFDRQVKDTTPVGAYSPQGDSPYGCADMAGNIWEHVSSQEMPYPYETADGREAFPISYTVWETYGPLEPPPSDYQWTILRGGSYMDNGAVARCASRGRTHHDWARSKDGFRVVLKIEP